MTEKRRVGEIRPSQLLFTYGIGSIVDLPELSVLVMGLEDWPNQPEVSPEIVEDRLLAAIRRKIIHQQVTKFRAPPAVSEGGSPMNPFDEVTLTGVPVATFPRWMVCPACRLLAPLEAGLFILKRDRYRPNRAYYIHENCHKAKKPIVIPARFLVACEEGHLDDFPWIQFVHGDEAPCGAPLLRLFEQGPSGEARDLTVRCEGCEKERRLAEAFGGRNREKMPFCNGRRPHLRDYDENGCERHMRPFVLGASNAWFPVVFSSIAIPSATTKLDQLVEGQWVTLQAVSTKDVLVAFRAIGQLGPLSTYSDDEIWAAIESKRQSAADDDGDVTDLKAPEWRVLTQFDPGLNSRDFRLNPVAPPASYASVIPRVILVERMREVRAITGFTRLDSPGELTEPGADDEIKSIAPLSRKPPKWLPAVEVRGEGIFIQFDEDKIRAWLSQEAIKARDTAFQASHIRWRSARFIENPADYYPGMRYVLLHTFSHALMRQLAIEAGYSSASIRERIYSRNPGDPNGPMAGILIYTAAPDSEGTLGGLVKLGENKELGRHITAALDAAALCASDPTCAEHPPSTSGIALHAAACHACLFVPETSCERGNRYLDRSVLGPTFERTDLAFFDPA